MATTVREIIEKLQAYEDQDTPMIALLWQEEDVMGMTEDKMTREEAQDILGDVESAHDCCYGVNWTDIANALENHGFEPNPH